MSARVVAEDRPGQAAWRTAALQRLWAATPALRYCAAVYLVVRVALFVLASAAWSLSAEPAAAMPDGTPLPLTSGWHNAITDWNREDANWYLYVASHGYSAHDGTAVFLPGYPMLVRLVGYLCFGHLLLAAYLVSNAALLAGMVIMYRLTEREYDVVTARRAVLYLAIFPTAVFLFGLYSEALFLMFAVGALALARQGRWAWAVLVGIGATLTRSVGLIVALALAVEAIHQTVEWRRQRNGISWRATFSNAAPRLGASVLPLSGTIGYLLYWQLRYHDWYRPISLQKTWWQRDVVPPWQPVWRGLELALRSGSLGGQGWAAFDFVLVAAGLMLGIWVAVRARPVYAVYTWGCMLFGLADSFTQRPLATDPRYLVVVFPLAWALARLSQRQGWHDAVVACSAASLAIVSWLFLTTVAVY